MLSTIITELERGGHNDLRDRLIDETLRYPRRHPRAFYWYVKRLSDDEALTERASYTILFQILDAIGSGEFSPARPPLKAPSSQGPITPPHPPRSPNQTIPTKIHD